jgi:uncharacterized membrane protein YphA (DoxX/SURF4 family)
VNRCVRLIGNNADLAICASLAVASIYYLVIREALPHTSLGRTFGDPWDWLVVVATLVCSVMVLAGTGTRIMLRALGLVGLCTLILLIDLTYLHQRGLRVSAYAILSNLGIVVYFAARARLIATLTDQ